MAWSPDQELVVFSTGTGNLLLMTHQLDPSGDTEHELVPVTETPMCSTEFGEGSLVLSAFVTDELGTVAGSRRKLCRRKRASVCVILLSSYLPYMQYDSAVESLPLI